MSFLNQWKQYQGQVNPKSNKTGYTLFIKLCAVTSHAYAVSALKSRFCVGVFISAIKVEFWLDCACITDLCAYVTAQT